MKRSSMFTIFDALFKAKITPLLIGHKGLGKTEGVEQYAKENGYRFLPIKLGNMQDAADLLGLFEFIKDPQGNVRSKYARPDFWPMNPDDKVLIFFDEINRANRQLRQPVMEMALEHRHHDWIAPEKVRFAAAMNPNTDEYEVESMDDAALLDRFCHLKFTPTVDEWSDYMHTKGADARYVGFFRENPIALDGKMSDFSINTTPSRRKADALINRILIQDLPDFAVQEIVMGLLGPAEGQSFFQFYKKHEKPLTAKDILDKLPEHRMTLEKFCFEKNLRDDLLGETNNDLIRTLDLDSTSGTKFTASQLKNLSDYLMMIPAGLAYAFCQRLLAINGKNGNLHHVREAIEENDALLQRMKGLGDSVKEKMEIAKNEGST